MKKRKPFKNKKLIGRSKAIQAHVKSRAKRRQAKRDNRLIKRK